MLDKISSILLFVLATGLIFIFSGCNYHYYQGKKLEEAERYEEANIEYHRAFADDADDDDYREAYIRTAKLTLNGLMKRYYRYVKENKFKMAFSRLEHARRLNPDSQEVKQELRKWRRILLSGKVTMKSPVRKEDIPLADEMNLAIRLNSPNPESRLMAYIDIKTGIFFVEDILYNPPQDLIMFYSINSVGIELIFNRGANQLFANKEFKNFISLGTPVLVEVKGELELNRPEATTINGLFRVDDYYPLSTLEQSTTGDSRSPKRGIRYYVKMDKKEIKVRSSSSYIDFLPQLLYFNGVDQRIFLDFGNIELSKKETQGIWRFKRVVAKERAYFKDLKKNLILDPYLYFREGGYPFVIEEL